MLWWSCISLLIIVLLQRCGLLAVAQVDLKYLPQDISVPMQKNVGENNRVCYLFLLGSWAFWPSICPSLRAVTRPMYGRFSFLTFHPIGPLIYPYHALGLMLDKYALTILSVAAARHLVFTSTRAAAATGGAGLAESWCRLVQQRLMSNAIVCCKQATRTPCQWSSIKSEPCKDVWKPAERVAGRLTLHEDASESTEPQ